MTPLQRNNTQMAPHLETFQHRAKKLCTRHVTVHDKQNNQCRQKQDELQWLLNEGPI